MNILIAEDNPTNLRLFELVCQTEGYRTRTAPNGEFAVREVEKGGVDLVLMDVMMPDVDGIEAARRIRQLPGTASQVPILAISANATDENRRACREAGMDAFVPKPVRGDDLLRHIASLLHTAAPK